MKKLLTTISILLIATAAHAQTYTVERVIDGNTLKLTNGERVRLIGIDAPESRDNDKARRDSKRTGQDLETITKMGQEATEFVKGLIKPGQEVRLEFDVQERDKYGRLLAYVYFPSAGRMFYSIKDGVVDIPEWVYKKWIKENGITKLKNVGIKNPSEFISIFPAFDHPYPNIEPAMLNTYIIQMGYASPTPVPPNVKHADLFKKLYEEAREERRGLWKNKNTKDKIHILSEDQTCRNDEDCTTVETDCTAEACECGGKSVSKKSLQKYLNLLKECRDAYVAIHDFIAICDMDCPLLTDKCLDEKCSVIEIQKEE